MKDPQPIHTDRENARRMLEQKIASCKKYFQDKEDGKFVFSTYPQDQLLEDAEFRLRWLDCAPDGANHIVAPLQGKYGVPMGERWHFNVGPNEAVRNARIKHGRHPLSGELVA